MNRYLVGRLALIIPTVLVASFLVFGIMRVVPGDIVLLILSGSGESVASVEARSALEQELGLNKPLVVQYVDWLGSVLSGGFGGSSLESRDGIGSIIGRQLPVTLLLSTYTIIVSLLFAIPIGIISALNNRGWVGYSVDIVALSGMAMPGFLVAIAFVLGLMLVFGWSPPVVYSPIMENPVSHFQMLILPVLILAWGHSSQISRIIRSSIVNSMKADYVVTARSKGLSQFTIVSRHVMPNALIPIITVVGLQFGGLLGGVIVIETIFGIPGIGRGIFHAISVRDYPVVQTLACVLVLMSLMVNLIIDTTYRYLDPRIE